MLNPSTLTDADRTALESILAKSPQEVTEDEAAVLRARRDYLSEEQKANFSDSLQLSTDAPEDISKLKCEKLDVLATDLGLTPADYSKKDDIVSAIKAAIEAHQ